MVWNDRFRKTLVIRGGASYTIMAQKATLRRWLKIAGFQIMKHEGLIEVVDESPGDWKPE